MRFKKGDRAIYTGEFQSSIVRDRIGGEVVITAESTTTDHKGNLHIRAEFVKDKYQFTPYVENLKPLFESIVEKNRRDD